MKRDYNNAAFKWMDPLDSDVQYRNWNADSLKYRQDGDDCVVGVDYDPGMTSWVAAHCNYRFGFVCQFLQKGKVIPLE